MYRLDKVTYNYIVTKIMIGPVTIAWFRKVTVERILKFGFTNKSRRRGTLSKIISYPNSNFRDPYSPLEQFCQHFYIIFILCRSILMSIKTKRCYHELYRR